MKTLKNLFITSVLALLLFSCEDPNNNNPNILFEGQTENTITVDNHQTDKDITFSFTLVSKTERMGATDITISCYSDDTETKSFNYDISDFYTKRYRKGSIDNILSTKITCPPNGSEIEVRPELENTYFENKIQVVSNKFNEVLVTQ